MGSPTTVSDHSRVQTPLTSMTRRQFHQRPRPKGKNRAEMLIRSRTRLSSRYRRAPTARTPTTQTENHTPPSTPRTISVTLVQPVNWERSRKAKKAEKGCVSISKTG